MQDLIAHNDVDRDASYSRPELQNQHPDYMFLMLANRRGQSADLSSS